MEPRKAETRGARCQPSLCVRLSGAVPASVVMSRHFTFLPSKIKTPIPSEGCVFYPDGCSLSDERGAAPSLWSPTRASSRLDEIIVIANQDGDASSGDGTPTEARWRLQSRGGSDAGHQRFGGELRDVLDARQGRGFAGCSYSSSPSVSRISEWREMTRWRWNPWTAR